RDEVPRLASSMVRQLAAVVAFAHRLTPPIVHRDLKPANVLLSFSREPLASAPAALAKGSRLNEIVPKIADFGIGAIVSGQGMGTLPTQLHASRLPSAVRGSCTPL